VLPFFTVTTREQLTTALVSRQKLENEDHAGFSLMFPGRYLLHAGQQSQIQDVALTSPGEPWHGRVGGRLQGP
jgi:hypothetical protein